MSHQISSSDLIVVTSTHNRYICNPSPRMRFDLFFILIPLLCNGFSAEMQDPGNNPVISSGPIHQQESVKKVQFNDLNGDVVFVIFNFLNLADLLHMEYRRRHQNYEVKIFRSSEMGLWRHDIHIPTREDKCIEINNYDLGVSYLQHFGNWIPKLKISNEALGPLRSTVINRMANKYTSDSIAQLHLGFIQNGTLQQFLTPFEAVEELILHIHEPINTANLLPFNVTFPKLRRLRITMSADINYHFLDCTLPHLEHIHVDLSFDKTKLHGKQIESLFRRNQQIQTILLQNFPSDFYIQINEYLPNLDNLFIHEIQIQETVRSNSIHLTLHESYPSSLDKLSFSRLQSIELFCNQNLFDNCLAFFRRNQNLSKIYLKAFKGLEASKLIELLATLPDLIEIKTALFDSINIPLLSRIIETHVQLMKFEFFNGI